METYSPMPMGKLSVSWTSFSILLLSVFFSCMLVLQYDSSDGDIGALKEFQLYLDNVYDCDIDNLGMTIELVWVYEND